MPAKYQPQELHNPRTATLSNPRDSVSWYQSVAFARWLHSRLQGQQLLPIGGDSFRIGQNAEVRLPTEWEWQWAAQGGHERRDYPWGKWLENRANTVEAGLEQTSAAGMYPDGAAACGAQDMTGNVREWCLNKSTDGEFRMLLGGSFDDYRRNAASASGRRNFYPYVVDKLFGLRLVVSAPIPSMDG